MPISADRAAAHGDLCERGGRPGGHHREQQPGDVGRSRCGDPAGRGGRWHRTQGRYQRCSPRCTGSPSGRVPAELCAPGPPTAAVAAQPAEGDRAPGVRGGPVAGSAEHQCSGRDDAGQDDRGPSLPSGLRPSRRGASAASASTGSSNTGRAVAAARGRGAAAPRRARRARPAWRPAAAAPPATPDSRHGCGRAGAVPARRPAPAPSAPARPPARPTGSATSTRLPRRQHGEPAERAGGRPRLAPGLTFFQTATKCRWRCLHRRRGPLPRGRFGTRELDGHGRGRAAAPRAAPPPGGRAGAAAAARAGAGGSRPGSWPRLLPLVMLAGLGRVRRRARRPQPHVVAVRRHVRDLDARA